MSTNKPCPVCNEGYLHPKEIEDTLEYKGITKSSILYLLECDSCLVETAGKEELEKNYQQLLEFRKALYLR